MAKAPGPVTIVTGGSRGIGLAIAATLARDDHRLVLVARDVDRLAQAASTLQAAGADVATYAADLAEQGAADDVIRATEAHFGLPDIVINNAGTAPSDKVEKTTAEMMQQAYLKHLQSLTTDQLKAKL